MYLARLKSKSGFSLLEILIVVGLIGVAVFLVPQFLAIYSPREATISRMCESHAQSVIAAVQEETTHRNLVQWLDTDARRGIANPTFTPTRAIPAIRINDYWTPILNFYTTGTTIPASASAGARLQNAALIQGTLRTLSTIYNRNNAVQCTFGSYDPLTSPVNIPLSAALAQHNTAGTPVVVQIRIEPYLTTTNQSLCAGGNGLFPIPGSDSISEMTNVFTARSANTDVSDVEASFYNTPVSVLAPTYTVATLDNYRMANESNGARNVGYRLTAQVTYTADGEAKNCQVTQNFEYPIDNTPPAEPDDVVIAENYSVAAPAPAPTPQQNCVTPLTNKRIDLRIGYLAPPERGTVFLCRDLTYRQNRHFDDSVTTFNYNPATQRSTTPNYSGGCISDSGWSWNQKPAANDALNPFPRLISTLNPTHDPEEDNPPSSRYWDQRYRDFTSRENFWQPCDQLKLCGATASSVTLNNEYSMNLQYNSVPVGCYINFEVVGVDTAGNRSRPAGPLPTAPAQPSRGVVPTTSITEGNIVFPPTCGNSTSCQSSGGSCGSLGKENYSTYYFGGSDSGYYVPRRGVFCKPTRSATDDGYYTAVLAEPNATLHWSTNTVGGRNWRALFPNGYYTCRGSFGGTGGSGGSGSNGCCWDPPGSTTCTPYN